MRETSREAQLREHNERLERENALLRQKIDALIRRLFGSQSEQLDPAQLQRLLQGVENEPAPGPQAPPEPALETEPASPRPPAKHERTARLPEHLPVIEEVLDPEPVQACPSAWRCIGAEVSEQLDYEPARFVRRRLIRRKFVRRGEPDATPVIAPLPPCLQERGLPTAGLLAQVLIAKYADHLPLYRQEAIYRQRHGVHLPRQTLARWVGLAADWLRPIYDAIRTGVLAGGYIQVDETPIAYLEPGHGSTRQGYLWTYARPGGDALFDWQTGRGAKGLEHIIPADFTGTLQCDGHKAYPAFTNARPGGGKITLAGCLGACATQVPRGARPGTPAHRLTGANRNDVTQALPLVEAIAPVGGKPGRPRRSGRIEPMPTGPMTASRCAKNCVPVASRQRSPGGGRRTAAAWASAATWPSKSRLGCTASSGGASATSVRPSCTKPSCPWPAA